MDPVGRNDLCPCKSGKKYKHCYLSGDNGGETCIIYLQEFIEKENKAHEARVQKSMAALLSMTSELRALFHQDDSGRQAIPTRMQLVGIFTILDVLSHYYNEYNGTSLSTSERFTNYANRFFFVPENKGYAQRKYLGGMTVAEIISFRNGLVHFYGLADARYCILPNASRNQTEESIGAAHKNFIRIATKLGKELLYIQPFELEAITIQSASLLIEHFKTLEVESGGTREKRLAHIAGIKRIFDKLQKEGASIVDKETAESLDQAIARHQA